MKEVEKSMKFTGVEHFDRFDDEVVFWAELSGAPQEIQDKARAIDGEAYNPQCFGLCVFHSHTSKEWAIMTDTDLSNGDSRNIYYVDNNGDKHWFKAELPDSLIRQVFEACAGVDDGRDVVKASTLFENGRGYGVKEAKQPIAQQLQAAESLQKEGGGPAMPKKNAVRDDR